MRRHGEIIIRILILTNTTGVFGFKHMTTVIKQKLYCCTRVCPQNIPIKDVSHFKDIYLPVWEIKFISKTTACLPHHCQK